MNKNKENLETKNKIEKRKVKNKSYLKELQKFFDLADNIENEKLRKRIIYQMLKCDETITKIYENRI